MATTKSPLRAAIYTRISLDKSGERLGVQRQLEDCRALAAQLGWTIADDIGDRGHFDDNDLSAMNGTRPGFEALLDVMKRGEIDALICWHPDRLYRRLADLARLLDVAAGVEIRTVNGGEIDLSHSTGRMLATILGSVSTQESEHKAERQKRAARQKAEQGKPQWKRAFGYIPDTRSKEQDDGTRLVDPVTAPLVKQAYKSVLAGGSISDVAREWNKAGAYGRNGKPWSPSTVTLFLRKPRNAGLRAHNGEIVGNGTWPELVDEDLWRAVQGVLNAPGRAPGRKSVQKHRLTGVMRCGRDGCDGTLSGLWVMQKTGGPRAHSITYQCNRCRGVSVRAEYVEPLVDALLAERLARPDAVDLLKSEQHDAAEAEQLRTERATLLARLDEIADERADGLIDGKGYRRATDRINDKIAAIDRRSQDQERLRVFDGLPLGTPEIAAALGKLSTDRLRAVMGVVMTLTIAPVGKSGKTFNRERVQVAWR
jgi:DNA invertase Pin-like site-specific DNA recombinase